MRCYRVPEPQEEARKSQEDEMLKVLSMGISELNLSMRSSNCLEAEQIKSVGDLVVRTESDLLNVRNFGKTSLKEIISKLEELGLQLGMPIPQHQ